MRISSELWKAKLGDRLSDEQFAEVVGFIALGGGDRLLRLMTGHAQHLERENARLRAALVATRLPHADDWGEICPRVVQARGDRCLTCKYKGRPECTCTCTCIADEHNAAIDAALSGGQS